MWKWQGVNLCARKATPLGSIHWVQCPVRPSNAGLGTTCFCFAGPAFLRLAGIVRFRLVIFIFYLRSVGSDRLTCRAARMHLTTSDMSRRVACVGGHSH